MADTMCKIVAFGGVALVGYITYNKIVNDKSKPDRRKHKVSTQLSDMDKQIHEQIQNCPLHLDIISRGEKDQTIYIDYLI